MTDHKATSASLLSLREARERLGGISPQLLHRLVSDEELRLVKIRRRSFIRRDDIEALIDRNTIEGSDAPLP